MKNKPPEDVVIKVYLKGKMKSDDEQNRREGTKVEGYVKVIS